MSEGRRIILTLLLTVAVVAGCNENPSSETGKSVESGDLSYVTSEVEAAVWAFHAADTARNAEAVIMLLWPEFEMLVDGNRVSYDDAAAGSREFMPSLEIFATDWSDLRITPLGPDHAVASFRFRDSIVTKTGNLIQAQGPTTFVWERRHGEWRILFADADHYPLADE